MTKRKRTLAIVLLSVSVVIALIVYINRPKPVVVTVKAVERGEVLATVANTRAGTLKACRRARLSPSIGGQIAELPVREGDKVKAGQLLLEIWNDDLRAQLELARREAKAAEARAREACVVAAVTRREAKRLIQLRKQGLASEESADKAQGDARAREAACEAVRTSAEVSQSNIDVAKAAVARTRLTAPFAGNVAEVNGELGEFLTPSPLGVATLPAVDLIDYTCVYVSAPIDEVDAPNIRIGMPARISLDAFSGKIFEGKVRRVAAYVLELEKQARTVEIEVDFADTEDTENMLPGYSADAEVILDRRKDVGRIPTEALMEGNKVLVFKNDGVLEQRRIETGMSNWSFTEVRAGLELDEKVVLSVEREGVKDGAKAIIETANRTDD